MCIWLPMWPLQRRRAIHRERKASPLVLYDRSGRGGFRVVCSTPDAERAGVVPGLPLAEAQALLPGTIHPQYQRHDPAADRAALRKLAARCQRFSPYVGLEEGDAPESLLLDLEGVPHLFGGETRMAATVAQEFRRWGYRARLAVADTVGAAWAVAHAAPAGGGRPVLVPAGGQASALVPLPVEMLRLPPETIERLHALGLRQIGALRTLPRADLPSRFGADLLRRLDQALGQVVEPFIPYQPAAPIEAEWPLESPTDDRRVLEALCETLLGRLLDQLAPRREGLLRLWCSLAPEKQSDAPAGPVNFAVELVEPRACPRHLGELLRLHLERLRLPAAVAHVRLLAVQTAPLACRQRDLFGMDAERERGRALARLVDRLSGRLGAEAVLRPRLHPDHQPEYAVRYLPALDARPSSSAARTRRRPAAAQPPAAPPPLTRPVSLRPQPVEVDVLSVVPDGPPLRLWWQGQQYVIARRWGPERIETGWWRRRDVRRDYYRVETADGRWLWIFRDLREDRWYLHGTFE